MQYSTIYGFIRRKPKVEVVPSSGSKGAIEEGAIEEGVIKRREGGRINQSVTTPLWVYTKRTLKYLCRLLC